MRIASESVLATLLAYNEEINAIGVPSTLLVRFLETSDKIPLGIDVVRLFLELELVPTLSSRPPPSLSMFQNLLVHVKCRKMTGNSFNPIRFVDLAIDVLQSLV